MLPTASHAQRGHDEDALIRRAMDGIDPKRFLMHIHVVGVGRNTGCVSTRMMDKWSHPAMDTISSLCRSQWCQRFRPH